MQSHRTLLTESRKSNAEIHDLLARRDSRNLLDRVSNDASSLRSAEDTRIRKSIADGGLAPSLKSTFDEIEFAFDFELINTATYRKAFHCASRQNLAQLETSKVAVVQKPPTPMRTITHPIEEDLLLDMSTDGDDNVEEIVSEGAKQLSNPAPQAFASYGNFTAPPNTTQIVTPKPHAFQVAEIVSPVQSSDPTPTSDQSEYAPTFYSEDPVIDIRKALENMMLSQFEDIMPVFCFDAGRLPAVNPIAPDDHFEGASLTPSLNTSIANTKYDTPRTSCDLESSLLIDISIPDVAEAAVSREPSNLQALMELESSTTTMTLEVEEPFSDLVGSDLLETIIGSNRWALKPRTKPNLQGFLEYLTKMERPILPFIDDSPMDSIVETRVQRILKISPHSETGLLFNGESPSLVPATTPKEISSLAKYSLETMVYSSAYSQVVKGRKTDMGGDVVGADVAFSVYTMLTRDSLPLRSYAENILPLVHKLRRTY